MRRVILPLMLLPVACRPPAVEVTVGLTDADKAAVADELTQTFADYADVVRQLDHDALMGFFQQSDDLVWVHDGTVARSWMGTKEAHEPSWAALERVNNFQWGDLHVQALASNVAVVTTTFEFAASDTTGAPLALNGSFLTVWVHTDGGWKVVASAETYPLTTSTPY